MSLTIELPAQLEEQLRVKFGGRLMQEAKEAMAIEMYRETKLSIGQVAQLLGKGVMETETWLFKRGVEIPMTVDDLMRELERSHRLLNQK